MVRLTELSVKKRGVISDLDTSKTKELRKLISMGALPGAEIELLQVFPVFVFRIGYSSFAVDKELASLIFIKNEL